MSTVCVNDHATGIIYHAIVQHQYLELSRVFYREEDAHRAVLSYIANKANHIFSDYHDRFIREETGKKKYGKRFCSHGYVTPIHYDWFESRLKTWVYLSVQKDEYVKDEQFRVSTGVHVDMEYTLKPEHFNYEDIQLILDKYEGPTHYRDNRCSWKVVATKIE